MARLFDDASDEYTYNNSIFGLTDYPFTLAAWFNVDSTAPGLQTIIAIYDSVGATLYHKIVLRDPADTDLGAFSVNGGNGLAFSTAQYSINTWHHALGVFTSATSRTVYLDGGNSATDTTNIAFGAPNKCGIAGEQRSTFLNGLSGKVAEAAVWDAALTSAEAVILAAGYSPLFVRPQSLVSYPRLIGRTSPEIDIVGGYDMILGNGPTVAAHPPIIYPSSYQQGLTISQPTVDSLLLETGDYIKLENGSFLSLEAAAAAGIIPLAMYYARRRVS